MRTERHNFFKDAQMHLCCGTNDLQPQFHYVYFKNGFAYATNGHILVRNRLDEMSNLDESEIAALDGKLMLASSYKDILKYDTIMIAEDGIECTKGNDKCFFYFAPANINYPNAEALIQSALNKPATALKQFSFNMDSIQKIEKALYNSSVCTATFKGENDYIVFDSNIANVSSIGILTPCLTKEENLYGNGQ